MGGGATDPPLRWSYWLPPQQICLMHCALFLPFFPKFIGIFFLGICFQPKIINTLVQRSSASKPKVIVMPKSVSKKPTYHKKFNQAFKTLARNRQKHHNQIKKNKPMKAHRQRGAGGNAPPILVSAPPRFFSCPPRYIFGRKKLVFLGGKNV